MSGHTDHLAAATQITHVSIHVEADVPDDLERLDILTARLRHELAALALDAIHPLPAAAPPAGAKGIDAAVAGGLLVSLANSPALLEALVHTVGDWIVRVGARQVRVELDGDVLEISRASATDQRQLVEQWIERHAHI
jgi:hypothetical protein